MFRTVPACANPMLMMISAIAATMSLIMSASSRARLQFGCEPGNRRKNHLEFFLGELLLPVPDLEGPDARHEIRAFRECPGPEEIVTDILDNGVVVIGEGA